MHKIEIKRNRKKLFFVVGYFSAVIFGSLGLLFFTEIFETRTMKIVVLIADFALAIYVLRAIITMVNNFSILTFSDRFLEINDNGKPKSFEWSNLKDIEIIEKDHVKYLVAISDSDSKKTSISSLEKEPEEIEELLNQMMSTRSENGFYNK